MTWATRTLVELGDVSRGRSRHRPRNDPSLYGGDIPFVQTGDVKAAVLHLSTFKQTYNEAGLAQSRLWNSGTVCLTIAANIAETAILAIPACFPDSVVGITVDESEADRYFVKYLVDFMRQRMTSVARGATQDNLSLGKLLEFEFLCPPLEVQRRIAGVLRSLDEFIEAAHEECDTLHQWLDHFFEVTFPEEGAGERLDTIVDFVRGVEPGRAAYLASGSESTSPFARVADLATTDLPDTFVPTERLGDAVADPADILVSFDGTPGRVRIGHEGGFSSGIRRLDAASEVVTWGFLYCLMRSREIQAVISAHSTGTTILHATSAIPELRLPASASPAAIKQFERPASRLLHRYLARIDQIRAAAAMREVLLPKLVSGDIDVSDLVIGSPTEDAAA
jgi:type I restriction enzyme S subunit